VASRLVQLGSHAGLRHKTGAIPYLFGYRSLRRVGGAGLGLEAQGPGCGGRDQILALCRVPTGRDNGEPLTPLPAVGGAVFGYLSRQEKPLSQNPHSARFTD
jgi:hypothetical protein